MPKACDVLRVAALGLANSDTAFLTRAGADAAVRHTFSCRRQVATSMFCSCVLHAGRKARQEDVNPFSHSTVQRTTKAHNKLPSLTRTIPINTLPNSVSPFLMLQLSQPHKAAAVAPPVRTIQQPATQINTVPAAPLAQADNKKIEFQQMGKLKYKFKGLRLPTIGELFAVCVEQPACSTVGPTSCDKKGIQRPAHTGCTKLAQHTCLKGQRSKHAMIIRWRQHLHLQA